MNKGLFGLVSGEVRHGRRLVSTSPWGWESETRRGSHASPRGDRFEPRLAVCINGASACASVQSVRRMRTPRNRSRPRAPQPFDPQPEHGRGPPLATFPVVHHRFAGRAHPGGQLLLTQAEPSPQADESGCVIRRHGHVAHGHETTPAASVGPPIPRRYESCAGLSRGCRSELSEKYFCWSVATGRRERRKCRRIPWTHSGTSRILAGWRARQDSNLRPPA